MSDVTAQSAHAGNLSSPIFTGPNRLKLGIFHTNCTRGGTPTRGEGSIAKLDWPQQVRIAQAAERAGFEAIIPIARWRGYEGTSGFNREQYEVMPWAAGIAANTSEILIFATAHVPLLHPVRAAKEVATIDHISNGRFCFNVVAGWNEPELKMFGIGQLPHDERYAVAGEWMDFLKKLWDDEEEFDFDGKYFQSVAAISDPKPLQWPRPPIMSAGASKAGCDFAASHADICFVNGDLETLATLSADVKARAAEKGREVVVWTNVGLLSGETEADAQRQYDYFVNEQGDWDAAKTQMDLLIGGGGQSLDAEHSRAMYERAIAWQAAYPLIGTPEQIVDRMVGLADAGIDGLAVVCFDYEKEIESYNTLIRPAAADAGIRTNA